MVVTYSNKQNEKVEISPGVTNYVLPDSGFLNAKKIESPLIYINGSAFDVENGSRIIQIEQDNLEIEADGVVITVKVLCQKYRDETKFDYNILEKAFDNNLIDGKMSEYELFGAIEEDLDDLKITLCTFDRKFASITKDFELERILECVKRIPHIFQKPKQHLKQINEIRPAAVVSRIGQESISHLVSHSEHWKGIKISGLVPERLLARTLEDDFAIYENRAVKTLVDTLYCEMKKLDEETIDCHMQIEMVDSPTYSAERKEYFHARNILLKGMNEESVMDQQILLEEQKKKIDQILVKLGKCKATPLYRHLKRAKNVHGKLKKTNIFMMDKYYKYAFKLAELMQNRQEISPYEMVHDVDEEYELFCKILFLFALRYFNYEADDPSLDIFDGHKLVDTHYHFGKWHLRVEEYTVDKLNSNGFVVNQYFDNPIEVYVENIDIDEKVMDNFSDVRFEAGKLIFSTIPSEDKQEDIVKSLRETWPANKKKIWATDLKRILYARFSNAKQITKRTLFIPWKYILPNNAEELRQLISRLKSKIGFEDYDQVFILTPSRPNDLGNIEDLSVLNQLISYGMADNKNHLKSGKLGIIPIGLADINSYRRFTKIILMNMVELDPRHERCPMCGGDFDHGRGDDNNVVTCRLCGYQLIETICSNEKCKHKFMFSRYKLPKTDIVDLDNHGFNVIARESSLGFKNITEAVIENGQIRPVCPYCGQ